MNGWKNKETWLVNLWLGDTFTEQAEDGQKITKDFIRETVEYLVDSTGHGCDPMVRDLLNCALSEIDYDEIAKHYVSDGPTVDDDDEPEDEDEYGHSYDDDHGDGWGDERAEYHERIDMGRNEAGEWLGFM
jgi:hypothetical protein